MNGTRAAALAALLCGYGIFTVPASAETGLAQACAEGSGFRAAGSNICPTRQWQRPRVAPANVLSCTASQSSSCGLTATSVQFRPWADLASQAWVYVCAADIPAGLIGDPERCASAQRQWIRKFDVDTGVRGRARLTWELPTEYTDGSALPVEQLARTTLHYGMTCTPEALEASTLTAAIPSPAIAATLEGLREGQWCFAATATDTQDRTSELSDIATLNVEALPGVPAELVSTPDVLETVTGLAYTALKQIDRTQMQPVATVPIGTPCIASEATLAQGTLYFAVPRSAVTWAGSVEPETVWARCTP